MTKRDAPFHRVVLKISGEGFCEPGGWGISGKQVERIALEVRDVMQLGVQVAIVCGGGNFLRGSDFAKVAPIPAATAHYMGMLATVINALALQESLEHCGVETRVQSAIAMAAVCEPFIRRRCMRHLDKKRAVIIAAGTGRPFVTTDTAAALAAVELNADGLFKATKVDGVYTDDPKKNPQAALHHALTYAQVLKDGLKVMDVSAIDLCQTHGVPIVVFNLMTHGNMARVLRGEKIGTTIGGPKP